MLAHTPCCWGGRGPDSPMHGAGRGCAVAEPENKANMQVPWQEGSDGTLAWDLASFPGNYCVVRRARERAGGQGACLSAGTYLRISINKGQPLISFRLTATTSTSQIRGKAKVSPPYEYALVQPSRFLPAQEACLASLLFDPLRDKLPRQLADTSSRYRQIQSAAGLVQGIVYLGSWLGLAAIPAPHLQGRYSNAGRPWAYCTWHRTLHGMPREAVSPLA